MIDGVIPDVVVSLGIPGLALYYMHDLTKSVIADNTQALGEVREALVALKEVINHG